MTKSLRGAGDGAPFFGSKTLHICAGKCPNPRPKLTRKRRSGKDEEDHSPQFLDGIVNGERVHVHVPKGEVPSERNVELRIRAAVAASGCVVWKHVVDPCWQCGKKPTKRTGLGEGMSDLFVLVPSPHGARPVFIEVKRPGYSPSDVRPMQRKRLAHLRRIGVVAGIATCEEEALALVAEARAQ